MPPPGSAFRGGIIPEGAECPVTGDVGISASGLSASYPILVLTTTADTYAFFARRAPLIPLSCNSYYSGRLPAFLAQRELHQTSTTFHA